jgi:hypothetical protein
MTSNGIWSPASLCEQESAKSENESNFLLNNFPLELQKFYPSFLSIRAMSQDQSGCSMNDPSRKDRNFTVSTEKALHLKDSWGSNN